LSQAPRAAKPKGAKENSIASVTHESPLQTVPLLVEIDKESLEFASPRGAASTVDGDETPKCLGPPSNFPFVGGHGHAAPGFLNQGESESDNDEEVCLCMLHAHPCTCVQCRRKCCKQWFVHVAVL
jgi:hypothetical protein